MLDLPTGVTDVIITIGFVGAAGALIAGVDRFPPTRAVLDWLDPSRVWARHPSAGAVARETGTVRRIPITDAEPEVDVMPAPELFFDYERHA